MSIDLVAACAAVGIGVSILSSWVSFGPGYLGALAVAAPAIVFALWTQGLYRTNQHRLIPGGVTVLSKVARAVPVAMLATAGSLTATGRLSEGLVTWAAALMVLPAVLTVPLLRSAMVHLLSQGWVNGVQNVLIVGSGEAAEGVAERLGRYGGLFVVGMVDNDPLPGFQTIGGINDIVSLCTEYRVDRIIVALPRAAWLEVSEVLQPLIGTVDIAVVPSLHQLITWRSGTQDLAGMPLIPLAAAQQARTTRIAKRLIDLTVGSVALVLLAPVLIIAIVAIRLDTKGPAIFRQQRIGRGTTAFTMFKLRTMHIGAEARRAELVATSQADPRWFKLANDPRVTRVGALLRRYSIDELPQLFNVLGGTMSLVGPRPYPVVESEGFRVGSATSRFEMPPGMTGLWQVSGRSDLSWDDLCRLDAIYVKSWSLLWDLRILMQTPAAALRSQGAY